MLVRGFEGWHLVILGLLVTVLFGARRMPDAARSIGQSLRIFKSEMRAGHGEDAAAAPVAPAAAPVPPQVATQLPTAAPLVQSADDELLRTPVAAQQTASRS